MKYDIQATLGTLRGRRDEQKKTKKGRNLIFPDIIRKSNHVTYKITTGSQILPILRTSIRTFLGRGGKSLLDLTERSKGFYVVNRYAR